MTEPRPSDRMQSPARSAGDCVQPGAKAPAAPAGGPRRPSPLPTYTLTAAAFLVVLMLLAWQVRAGRDPAIGAAKPEAATPVKRIIVKRIERKVIITEPAAPAAAPASAPARGGAVAVSAPAAPAPAASAPAPAAPAPAPAPPAPVVATRSS